MNYYNEFDPHAAAWLRELIAQGLIPAGVVDERSITEIEPHELTEYTQCHFFCGIAGWPLALQLAGWPATRPVWTGSCPCQPYSAAGKGLGDEDPRNLWPAFFNLIRECKPERVFGEQVESAVRHGWLDGISADLEGEGYACGTVVLGAHSVFSPHIRQRLYWVADSEQSREWRRRLQRPRESTGPIAVGTSDQSVRDRIDGRLADRIGEGLQGHAGNGDHCDQPGRIDPHAIGSTPESGATGGRVGNPESRGLGILGDETQPGSCRHADGSGGHVCGLADDSSRRREMASLHDGIGTEAIEDRQTNFNRSDGTSDFWSGSRWIYCRDGKHRRIPTESVFQLVADGVSDRVGTGWGDLFETTPGLAEATKGFPLASGEPFKLTTVRGSVRPSLLKGAGNAIVPQVAAQFIKAFIDS